MPSWSKRRVLYEPSGIVTQRPRSRTRRRAVHASTAACPMAPRSCARYSWIQLWLFFGVRGYERGAQSVHRPAAGRRRDAGMHRARALRLYVRTAQPRSAQSAVPRATGVRRRDPPRRSTAKWPDCVHENPVLSVVKDRRIGLRAEVAVASHRRREYVGRRRTRTPTTLAARR